jgi:hypothetical protein
VLDVLRSHPRLIHQDRDERVPEPVWGDACQVEALDARPAEVFSFYGIPSEYREGPYRIQVGLVFIGRGRPSDRLERLPLETCAAEDWDGRRVSSRSPQRSHGLGSPLALLASSSRYEPFSSDSSWRDEQPQQRPPRSRSLRKLGRSGKVVPSWRPCRWRRLGNRRRKSPLGYYARPEDPTASPDSYPVFLGEIDNPFLHGDGGSRYIPEPRCIQGCPPLDGRSALLTK